MVAQHNRLIDPEGKYSKARIPSEEEFEAMKARWRRLNLPDVKV